MVDVDTKLYSELEKILQHPGKIRKKYSRQTRKINTTNPRSYLDHIIWLLVENYKKVTEDNKKITQIIEFETKKFKEELTEYEKRSQSGRIVAGEMEPHFDKRSLPSLKKPGLIIDKLFRDLLLSRENYHSIIEPSNLIDKKEELFIIANQLFKQYGDGKLPIPHNKRELIKYEGVFKIMQVKINSGLRHQKNKGTKIKVEKEFEIIESGGIKRRPTRIAKQKYITSPLSGTKKLVNVSPTFEIIDYDASLSKKILAENEQNLEYALTHQKDAGILSNLIAKWIRLYDIIENKEDMEEYRTKITSDLASVQKRDSFGKAIAQGRREKIINQVRDECIDRSGKKIPCVRIILSQIFLDKTPLIFNEKKFYLDEKERKNALKSLIDHDLFYHQHVRIIKGKFKGHTGWVKDVVFNGQDEKVYNVELDTRDGLNQIQTIPNGGIVLNQIPIFLENQPQQNKPVHKPVPVSNRDNNYGY